jgi:hypothetical protein
MRNIFLFNKDAIQQVLSFLDTEDLYKLNLALKINRLLKNNFNSSTTNLQKNEILIYEYCLKDKSIYDLIYQGFSNDLTKNKILKNIDILIKFNIENRSLLCAQLTKEEKNLIKSFENKKISEKLIIFKQRSESYKVLIKANRTRYEKVYIDIIKKTLTILKPFLFCFVLFYKLDNYNYNFLSNLLIYSLSLLVKFFITNTLLPDSLIYLSRKEFFKRMLEPDFMHDKEMKIKIEKIYQEFKI